MQKTRPAVIVNAHDVGILPLKVIVPGTDLQSLVKKGYIKHPN
jgi:hypothetical protein